MSATDLNWYEVVKPLVEAWGAGSVLDREERERYRRIERWVREEYED